MSKRSVTHATFILERTYDASPARAFAAWADPVAKARWFGSSDGWVTVENTTDFRIGGEDVNRSRQEGGGPIHAFRARYWDIVTNERIVYSYDMHLADERIGLVAA
jgi:uncharacterized protein YndB with AHSA1/START domain